MSRTMEESAPFPPWHRSRLRWVNGLGFAISFALLLIALLGVLQTLMPGGRESALAFPTVYAVVTFGALLATLGLFAVLLFRFAWRGERFDTYQGRLYVFFWSLAGGLFFLCLSVVWLRFDGPPLPNLDVWASEFLWFLCPFGVVTFGLMSWTNSDLPHRHEAHGARDDSRDDDEAWDDEPWDDEDDEPGS